MSDYKRLTKSGARVDIKNFTSTIMHGVKIYMFDPISVNTIISNLNRLAELEDKIEQGTLIELPCKVGDKFWCINETKYGAPFVMEMTVDYFKIINGVFYMGHFNCFRIVSWQKSKLFNTREEAEKRLKELQQWRKD